VGRIPRSSLPDGYYHVYARGVACGRAFADDVDRSAFLELLSLCERRHGWTCYAFTLLSTHYHLVLGTTREQLSAGVHRLNWRYARHFNRRHARFGHVFAERFSARLIESEEYLYDACEYVLLNPVKAGLCERAEDWPCSYSRFQRRAG
jgi:REP element-mobilizing transposase RayT